MSIFDHLESLNTYAVAADGGSLAICLADKAGLQYWFTLNRSISSRGSAAFNRISDGDGLLNTEKTIALMIRLDQILAVTSPEDVFHDVLAAFIEHVRSVSE